jgi:hypothetical protein
MRSLREWDQYQLTNAAVIEVYGGIDDRRCGVVQLTFKGEILLVIASTGESWDHLSPRAWDANRYRSRSKGKTARDCK